MDTLSYKTLSANKETANKEWFVVDAEGQTLGRMASKVAKVLRGKYKTNFTPHADCGDNVIIVNAGKIVMSGNKMSDRQIFSHTGYPGGQKRISPSEMLAKDETSVVRHAVKGMLPKNKLGAAILRNCFIYAQGKHDHEAQKPKVLNLNDLK
ncbi:MAG: 50S ribosomal protein L13 [Flavobacteriales bacterium]|nr:50S ribosomal protein L13 [Flavobacteriales bacterium]MDC3257817.1 50S ribosomal protein L13 [Flavobacteriales bacterium]MDG1426523.1 50S ribosomal protein L13 [Flavobacteriales bacterium]MDG1933825.1 50S ribosomal protein L13 [Flavobacteriales bacterium]MDG2086281.1 50S ribosomal protein L13 [Flavobacteriales bacterium]